jgi:hypothetical protein
MLLWWGDDGTSFQEVHILDHIGVQFSIAVAEHQRVTSRFIKCLTKGSLEMLNHNVTRKSGSELGKFSLSRAQA